MARINITLPDEIAERLSEKKNKSRFIAEALKERFIAEENAKLAKELEEGYKSVTREDKELLVEWKNAELDNWN